jgi:hypothetical protein
LFVHDFEELMVRFADFASGQDDVGLSRGWLQEDGDV